MRNVVKGILCALALVCAFALGQGDKGYTENDLALAREEAYNSGYHTGYDEGLTAQQQSLYEEAFAAGQAEGYDTGFSEGSAQGAAQEEQAVLLAVGDTFAQGYDAGYSEGYAQKQKDDQAAKEQYLASITPVLPVITPIEPETEAPPAEVEMVTVYITNSGTKYHLDGCRHLKSKIEKTLEEAKALKLEPCKVCNPPK